MKKEKYFIDLSKLSEDQRKSLPQKVNVFYATAEWLSEGKQDKHNPLLTFDEDSWIGSAQFHAEGRTELTYPDFIKLFEGGEGEKTDTETLIKKLEAAKKKLLKALGMSLRLNKAFGANSEWIEVQEIESLIQKMK